MSILYHSERRREVGAMLCPRSGKACFALKGSKHGTRHQADQCDCELGGVEEAIDDGVDEGEP